jgi:hypothetical protein
MPPVPYNELTRNDWTRAVQEAVKRAKKFTRSNARERLKRIATAVAKEDDVAHA